MAGFAILYHPKVVGKDIPKLDSPTRRRIRSAIERKLVREPEQFAKPLAYTRERLWSLRVGAWRVVFALREEEIWILRIGHRAEVYEQLGSRPGPVAARAQPEPRLTLNQTRAKKIPKARSIRP